MKPVKFITKARFERRHVQLFFFPCFLACLILVGWRNSHTSSNIPTDSCSKRFPKNFWSPTLKQLHPVPQSEKSHDRLEKYIAALGDVDLKDYHKKRQWFLHTVLFPFLVHQLSVFQHSLGIRGAAGEIGVHHGGFFLSLASSSKSSEQLFVVDIFDNQQFNTDNSGKGNLDSFVSNCALIGIDPVNDINIVKLPSIAVTSEALLRQAGGPVRMFSVDGGHTREATCHDMNLAYSLLHEGGIIILDDVGCCTPIVSTWGLGVIDGISSFFSHEKDLEPFFYHRPKLFFARRQYAQKYRTFLTEMFSKIPKFQLFPGDNSSSIHLSRRSMFGGEVLHLVRLPRESGIMEAWSDRRK